MKKINKYIIVLSLLLSSGLKLYAAQNIEFEIQIIGGNTTPNFTFLVNNTPITSTASPCCWGVFVDEPPYQGIKSLQSKKYYCIKTPNSKNMINIEFSPNYQMSNHPTIKYNVITKKFSVEAEGSNCTIKLKTCKKFNGVPNCDCKIFIISKDVPIGGNTNTDSK